MRLRSFVAAVALLSASLASRADTLVETIQTGSFGPTLDSTITVPFQMFNPALGTLTAISATLGGSITFSASLDPYEPNPTDTAYFDLVIGVFQDEFSTTGHAGTYQVSGTASTTDPANLRLETGNGTQDAALYVEGPGLAYISSNGLSGNITYTYTSAFTSLTPEPSSLALLGTGLLGVAGVIRKRLA